MLFPPKYSRVATQFLKRIQEQFKDILRQHTIFQGQEFLTYKYFPTLYIMQNNRILIANSLPITVYTWQYIMLSYKLRIIIN